MMVTCKFDSQAIAVPPKMNSGRTRKPSSSNSSEFRLLDSDQLEGSSSVSRNSIYKLKIDLMFDDSRSMHSSRLDDPHGSHRTRSIIMYGRSELAGSTRDNPRSLTSFLQESGGSAKALAEAAKKDVQRISNSVQAQIEQLFTDVAKDATTSFEVKCLGSLPLKDKVTSLQGLQEPLRQLYLGEVSNDTLKSGFLDICTSGLRIKIAYPKHQSPGNDHEAHITPFHNIAVWSAVKFVISEEEGGAAFLPLITDPENIDKTALFQPLSDAEHQTLANGIHAPIFAVVMRSTGMPKVLECHGFVCKSTEDAIVIAATLYQNLMAHVSTNSHRSTKKRTPRNQNGVSCISIASSSALTGSNYLSRSQITSNVNGRRSSIRSSSGSVVGGPAPMRSSRKKRVSSSSLSSNSNVINETVETSTEERKRRSHKLKRAPPVPTSIPGTGYAAKTDVLCSNGHMNICNGGKHQHTQRSSHHTKKSQEHGLKITNMNGIGNDLSGVAATGGSSSGSGLRSESSGDILTRVAIPRSGSFLNTGGLTRYKSRAARRHSGKLGGGGGSPLGFSELFNEFRLHENLHSLDDILYAIIDADGMSFNDLKPIYKEFLMKLAVTLSQDEIFQRSKNIMRRQKKKKQKKKTSLSGPVRNKSKNIFLGTKSLKKVLQFGQFRSCRGKPPKSKNKEIKSETKRKLDSPIVVGPLTNQSQQQQQPHHHRSRVATSGSDVSLVRHDNAFHGLNRNSSSGYVSCSECSYDSETCTCISADRCYCSLRTEQHNSKLRRNNKRNTMSQGNNDNFQAQIAHNTNNMLANRHSLISCKSDEKCYCSMVEEEPNTTVEDDSINSHSDTTWCDTDSCVSASKCYCKRTERRQRLPTTSGSDHSQAPPTQLSPRKPLEKLGLDYELFTISGNSKPVQPHEALSVKKSVEAAAVFADMKLSQTTDIKSLCATTEAQSHNQKISLRSKASNHSYATAKKSSHRKRESFSTDRANEQCAIITTPTSSAQKTCSADDLLSRLAAIERAVGPSAVPSSISSSASRNRRSTYQSMRAVSASLEDSLGYLP